MIKKTVKRCYDETSPGGSLKLKSTGWYSTANSNPALFPHTVLHSYRSGSHRMFHHCYPHIALEFIVKGTATFFQDDIETRLNAGELFIIQRGKDSGFYTMANEYYEKYAICISGSVLELLLETLHMNKVGKIVMRDVEETLRRIQEIEALLEEKKAGTEDKISELTYSLLLFLASENGKSKESFYPDELKNALSFLQSNYIHGDVRNSSIAAFAKVSIPTLLRMFNKYCGKTPMAHVLELRMELAKTLLRSSNEPIKIIADKVGYNNQLYFSTVFKGYTGSSPKKYREATREI